MSPPEQSHHWFINPPGSWLLAGHSTVPTDMPSAGEGREEYDPTPIDTQEMEGEFGLPLTWSV